MPKLSIAVTAWKAVSKGTLKGFCCVYIPALRLSIKDVTVHARGDSRWAALPAKAQIDRNQQLIRDPSSGKIAYTSILSWDSRAVADAFSARVVEALLVHAPDALDEKESVAMSTPVPPSGSLAFREKI